MVLKCHRNKTFAGAMVATQNADGHWHQNQWLGGKPYWSGIQLDEAAFPVLLAAALVERGALDGIPVQDMVRRALGRPCDRLDGAWRRYGGARPDPDAWVWTPGATIASVPAGKDLWLVLPQPATLRLGLDGCRQMRERDSAALGLGLHGLRLPAAELADHASLR
jgi:hypothetical protein